MKDSGSALWLAVVTVGLAIAWWVVLLGSAAVIAVLAVLAAVHAPLRVSVPVRLALPSDTVRVRPPVSLSGASASLGVRGSGPAVLIVLGVVAAGVGLVLVIIFQLRRLVAALRAGRPFTAANARRVTVVGGALVLSELLRSGVLLAGSWWAARHVHASGVVFRAGFPLRIEVLAAGVLLIVFAEVFRRGSALQQDHDLTI